MIQNRQFISCLLLSVLLFAGVGAQRTQKSKQQDERQEDTIKLRADLVSVVATVVDSRGRFVDGLKLEDFELTEDDKPQQIASLSREGSVPLRLALLIDTSTSVRPRLKFEQGAASRFLKELVRPADRVALFSFNTEVNLEQELTGQVDKLIAAIKELKSRGATALYTAVYTAAEYLNAADGRRVIVILSDGADTVSDISLQTALRKAQESDCVIYAIYAGGRVTSANLRDPGAEQALIALSTQTGGAAFFPDELEDLNEIFEQLAAELRAQYVLGFYSSNDARDGSYRYLVLRVKQPGVTVRARKGYYAPRD